MPKDIIKVAIDSGPNKKGNAIRGVGFYTNELFQALSRLSGLKVDLIDFSEANLSEFDILHYPAFPLYIRSLPLFKPGHKVVITIHDLIYLIYPEAYPSGVKGAINFFLQKKSLRYMDALLTVSQTSKKDILRLLPVDPKKVYVTYEGPQNPLGKKKDKEFVKRKYDLPTKYILYVGDVNYNKNILTLAKAAKIAKLPLVIGGKQAASTDFDKNHIENRSFVEFLESFGQDPDIKRVGFIPTEELPAFYELASVYCQPSFYEGFGLPLLEAFKYSCPVVASKTQALVEVGGDAPLYVDPKSEEDMADKILEVVNSKNKKLAMIKKGTTRLKDFSWEKTAMDTYNVYKEVLNENQGEN